MRAARLVAAILAVLALAGCGATERAAGGGGAPPTQRGEVQLGGDVPRLTTAQAARKAERIALVVSLGSHVVEGVPGTPFTRTRFAVQRVLKGRLPHRFVLQVIGGRLGNVVVDSPVQAFASSRRYVLFLGPDGPAGPTIIPQVVLRPSPGNLSAIRRALR